MKWIVNQERNTSARLFHATCVSAVLALQRSDWSVRSNNNVAAHRASQQHHNWTRGLVDGCSCVSRGQAKNTHRCVNITTSPDSHCPRLDAEQTPDTSCHLLVGSGWFTPDASQVASQAIGIATQRRRPLTFCLSRRQSVTRRVHEGLFSLMGIEGVPWAF